MGGKNLAPRGGGSGIPQNTKAKHTLPDPGDYPGLVLTDFLLDPHGMILLFN